MSTSRVMAGVSFQIPDQGDTYIWGTDLAGFLAATANGTFQKTGGLFAISADADFGASYGLKLVYLSGRGTVATAGMVRLAASDTIQFRNNANTGNNTLSTAADVLTYTGAIAATNFVGNASTATTVTTNANLTGVITSVGNATSVASQTGTGTTFAMSASPTFTGTVTAPAYVSTSTKRVKKAVKDLSQSYLDGFSKLKPREYDRKDYVAHEFGFIAEEMELIYPEVVGYDQNGKAAGIDYGKLSTILTAKVQEQQTTIDILVSQVAKILVAIRAV